MSMMGGGATANVNIKVDVDDAGAEARIAALEKRLKALENSSKSASGASKSFNSDLDKMSSNSKKLSKDYDKLAKTGDTLKTMFGRLGKFVKYAGIEFLGFTAALAAMKLALVAGQYVMKGFHALLRGTGAAAGVAVAAIGTVLAAMRELQAANLAPMMGGMKESRSQMNAVYADRRFAMFDEKTMGSIISSAASQGKKIDAAFRNQLARYADFSMGDPKKLAEIQKTFMQMEKDKKVTAKTYAELQQSAPMLAKAFDEMAGSQKKGEAAAKAGTVSYKKFFDAVNEGKLKALVPFNGALDQINNTLIGRLKASFRGVKEQLTRLGEPFLKTFRGPINLIEREISTFVLKINGTLQKVFPTLFKIGDTNNNVITRMFDRLANSINANMANIASWGDKIRGWGASIRNFFGGMGDSLKKMTSGWDKLYKGVLKPIGKMIGENLVYALNRFNGLIDGSNMDNFTVAIDNFSQILHNVIDGFFTLKKVMEPILQMFLSLANVVASLTGGPFKMLLPLLLMGKMMGGAKLGGGGAKGNAAAMAMGGMSMMGAGPLGMLAMPLMMGMSGFGARTQAASTSNSNYAANRGKGHGVFTSALYSGGMGSSYLGYRDQGMTRRTAGVLGFIPGAGRAYQEGYKGVEAKHKAQFRLDRQNEFNNYVKNPALAGLTQGDLTDKHGNILTKKQLIAKHGNEFGVRDATGLKLTSYEAQRAILDTMKSDPGSVLHERNDPARQKMIKDEATKAGKEQAKSFTKNAGKQLLKTSAMMGVTIGASLVGAAISSRAGTNQGMAALGGGLSGAGTGASMGAAFGPWGMAIGAIAGGAIGAYSGWKNAGKLRAAQKKNSMANVRNAIMGGRTFNTQEDFKASLEAAAQTKTDLDKLTAGSKTNLQARIDAEKAKKTASQDRLMTGFLAYASKQTGKNVTFTGKTGKGTTAFKFDGGDGVDSENNKIENLARGYAKKMGYSDEAIKSAFSGKGEGKGTVGGLQYLAGLQYDLNISDLETEMKKLKETYEDVGASTEEYKKTLKDIEDKQKRFTENTGKVSLITGDLGISMDQVASLFAKTGRSLSDTLPGIEDFNKLIGMTGDTATRVANGAGRLGRALFAQTQADMDIAESRSRLETQLQTMFATKGNIGSYEGTRVAGETLNEVINNSMAELAAGNVTFEQLTGAGAENGMLQNQLTMLVEQAKKRGVSSSVITQLENSIYGTADATTGVRSGGMLDKVNAAKTDPFARMQFDGQFSTDFEEKMKAVATSAAMSGKPISEAISSGTTELATWLQSQGIQVDQETMGKLQTMLGGTMQNSASAMQQALQTGGAYAADAIRAAVTGQPAPTPPPITTTTPGVPAVPGGAAAGWGANLSKQQIDWMNTPRGPAATTTPGDTTTSRFSRTLAAHSSLNAMVPGRRLVTSGIRNTNVGSMNSDHITGRAFDLTGDNLVSYAQNVKDSGGFAEFHGGPGADRHLHVVPPVGDSTSPVSGNAGGGGTNNYYTIEVNGGPGIDEETLANKVIDKIKRAERTSRERR